MHILITGGAGFVGSHLAISFKEKYPHYKITCLDNLKRRGSELNLTRLKAHSIGFVHADIRNPEDLEGIEPFDCLIDASAEPSVLAGLNSSMTQLINNNLFGTVNCLELAKKFHAKFIFLSTSRVYPIGSLESVLASELPTRFTWQPIQTLLGVSEKGISEDFPLTGSRSFYGATKLASELLIQEYFSVNNLPTVINRCGVIGGAGQMGKVDQGFMVLWVARHYWKQKLNYIGYGGEGKQVRDVLHPTDLFKLIDLQVHNTETFAGKTFNVGGGLKNSISLQELTTLCEKSTGNMTLIEKIKENRPLDLKVYISDYSQIETLCGWSPTIPVSQIVDEITDWIQKNEKMLEPILNS
ncbi:NAD-dependent epimerase/dehydratase family protein [Cytophagaceae bacterium DM2B3-1]|uniref:NAD-dependent epimerase/dehydratase family protein n=1 Tax=Xanthocytophaga flava TaxID=3048013 RepID=A0ABT7CE03_9BACT|nr:NAD-dependent epimerase/dehydratase family protein [Xanthocytophaga flavus]MDJ1491953.1 NAD-dependent epimerase/dehydratase family protein [Xanthocytophaga flavus]